MKRRNPETGKIETLRYPRPSEDRSRWARYRDRQRGGPPRPLRPHGTVAAWWRHKRAGEEPCEPCQAANADYQREQYLKRKARQSQ